MQVQMKVKRSASVGKGRQRSAKIGNKIGKGRQRSKKNAYIPKINDNKFDSARSMHIMGVVVQFFDSLSLSRGTANRSGINAKQTRNDRGVRILASIDCRHMANTDRHSNNTTAS